MKNDTLKCENQAENRVQFQYNEYLGQVVLVNCIGGYGPDDDSHEIFLSPPAKVLIEKTNPVALFRWQDDWLDPYYDVTLAEPHPQLEGMRSFWICGTSINGNTLAEQPGDIMGIVP
jgi:hypothetical protein